MYQTTNLPNTRLHIADVLRGIAVMGIILIHNVEHMEFYSFPDEINRLRTVEYDKLLSAIDSRFDIVSRLGIRFVSL